MNGRHYGRRDGLVWSTCWCDTEQVLVTPDDVYQLRTVSCGAPGCNPQRMRVPVTVGSDQ